MAAAGPNGTITVVVHLARPGFTRRRERGTRSERQRAVVAALRTNAVVVAAIGLRLLLASAPAAGERHVVHPAVGGEQRRRDREAGVIDEMAAQGRRWSSITIDAVDIVSDRHPDGSRRAERHGDERRRRVADRLRRRGSRRRRRSTPGSTSTHPDLTATWRGGCNSWFDPYGQHPATPFDMSGHGTAVTGAMVAGGAGGTTIGVAPGARWIAARMFDDAGNTTAGGIHAGTAMDARSGRRPGDRGRPGHREQLVGVRGGGLQPRVPGRPPGASGSRHRPGVRGRQLRARGQHRCQPGQLPRVGVGRGDHDAELHLLRTAAADPPLRW